MTTVQSIFGKNKCPHCQVTAFLEPNFTGLNGDIDGNWFVYYSTCPNCNRLVIELHGDRHPRTPADVGQLVTLAYPKSIQRNPPPPEVPEEFTKDYLEAAIIIRDSPKASAAAQ